MKILKLFTNHEKKLQTCQWLLKIANKAKELKKLTPKQMLQTLPIKADNTSENLLSDTRQFNLILWVTS